MYRKDIAGTTDTCTKDSTEDNLLDKQDDTHYFGGKSSDTWGMFMQSLQDAANGLNMAMGIRNYSSSERHHIASNKNNTYTPQYKEITDQYNFSLDSDSNVIELENHRGRHTNAYHNFILTCLRALDTYANGNIDDFYMGFRAIVKFIEDNPWLPYAQK